MVWKRNSVFVFWLCLASVICAQDEFEPETEEITVVDSTESFSEESLLNNKMADPGGQEVFEEEPLLGKKTDKKALEDRVKNVNYAEKDLEVKPKDKGKRYDPPVDLPTSNIERFKEPIFWTALLILLGIIVYLILKTGKRNRFKTTSSLAGPKEWQEAWNLDPGSLENDLQDAVESGNYRLAIRLLYLKNLKQLIDKDYVKPSPEKTNRQYVAELEKAGLAELFGVNTRVYETAWYGEATLDVQQYRRISPSFHDLFERSRR
jgi:hypothetical protein